MKKRLSLCLLFVLAGCSDTVTTPTTPTAQSGAAPVVGVTRTPRDLTDPSASWAMTGPTGLDGRCLGGSEAASLPGHELIWTLTMRDAGETGIARFHTMAFHEDEPGCLATTANPRDRIKQPGGPASYPPHGSGSTTFAAPANEWSCGRSQFDIETEGGVLLVGLIVDFGTSCRPTTPSPGPPHMPPPPLPTPVICPDTNDLFLGEPRWTAVGDRLIVDFLLKPALQNVQLSLASYKINTAPEDRLVGWTTGLFTGSGSMSITAASCSAQLDLLRCGPPLPVWPAGVEPLSAWYNNPCAEQR